MRRLEVLLLSGALLLALLAFGTVWGLGSRSSEASAVAVAAEAGNEAIAHEGNLGTAAGETPGVPEPVESMPCYVGVLVPRGTIDVVTQIRGTLEQLTPQIGGRVAGGEEIAIVSSPGGEHRLREQKARLEAMRSSLRIAEVGSAHARREMERRQAATQLFSSEQIEAAQFQAELAELELERQRSALAETAAALSRVENELGRGRIQAPFDGTVSARYAVPGSVLEAGQPLIRLVSAAGSLVRFAVPTGDLESFAPGSTVRVEIAAGSSAPAVVETVAPVLDEASQLIFVEAGLAGEALPGAPAGTVSRVGLEGQASCLDRPVTVLPS